MRTLYVLYDSHCGLCTEVRDWLQTQPAYLDLRPIASDSEDARRMFPEFAGELAVVSDDGQVWLGDRAFIVCLWALHEFRGWARRLSTPLLRPMARQAFAAVSRNRQSVSALLGLRSEAELKKRLNEVTIPGMPDQIRTKTKSEETKDRILRSALDMFHDRGFDSTTMREIAAKAEVATGAAYYYFDSKDAIVLAFYDRARRDMGPLMEQALGESRELRERLRRIIRVKLEYFAPSRKLLGALSAHTNPEYPLSPFSDQTREIREEDIRSFELALEGSRTPGPKDLKRHLPRLLWMYQMGIILYWINDSSRKQAKTDILLEKSLDLVTRLIRLAGLPLTGPIRKSVIQLMDALIESGA